MSGWWLPFEPRPAARLRLYCLPCAGGGASMYRQWPKLLPEWIELRAVRLPGRQGRHREASYTDCDTAADALVAALGHEPREPFAFFGHSMGAMISYRMTQMLVERGAPAPALLAVASWPQEGVEADSMPDPDDDRFAESLKLLGGVPPEMLADPEVLRLSLPVVRDDFRLCRSYRRRAAAPLPVPVAAFVGAADTVTPPDAVAGWQAHSEAFLGLHTLPGGHFFLHDQPATVVRTLVPYLERVLDGGRRDDLEMTR